MIPAAPRDPTTYTMTLWTDGSSLPSGATAAAIVGFVGPREDGDGVMESRIQIRRRAAPGPGFKTRVLRRTYGSSIRSIERADPTSGYKAESWSLGGMPSSFDAEFAALVRAVEICAVDAKEGACFNRLPGSYEKGHGR